jgi:hypothetical protein
MKRKSLPAGPGRGTYVLHEIKDRFYWYRHYYDPDTQKTKTVREDPPNLNELHVSISEKDEISNIP